MAQVRPVPHWRLCHAKTPDKARLIPIQKCRFIKFLVELTNDTCTSAFFVGTPIAEEMFSSQEHLKRRTRGMRLLPFKPDGAYRAFLQAIWPYQLTSATAPLSEQLANKLYGHSGGNPGLHREDIPGIPSAGPASRGELHLRQDDAAGH